ncbi:LysE/ArgO family amino acid transporter [Pelosinus sp. sgz500959]|uniref:LysE/ArgO family amino acid transporter n=1 Tax=Pelosinus sp. sgz500959 TaxID=3242472 RepID=UPI0036725411
MQAFIHGMVLAMGLILPLGIQNLFVFTQGVTQPTFVRTLPVVVTASICDTILILLAVQGVSLFIASFAWIKVFLLGIGIIFLSYMGWLTWNQTLANGCEHEEKSVTLKQQIFFAVTVSLFNPHAVLDTIGVIGTSSINYVGSEKNLFTTACILISWCWFLFLAVIGWKIGKQEGFAKLFVSINKISAVFMWLSAIYMAYSNYL